MNITPLLFEFESRQAYLSGVPNKHAKRLTIDLGLRQLVETAQPNQVFTQEAIAQVCHCHRGRIAQIERDALKKLRNKLRWGSLKDEITAKDLL